LTSINVSKDDFPANISPDAIEREEVIPRINSIADLESLSPYPNAREHCWPRMLRAIRQLPSQHQFAALCLFASVIYLGKRTLDDAWRYLFRELRSKYGLEADSVLEETFVLTEDPANYKEFLHCNQIRGRLDAGKHPRLWGIGDVAREVYLEKLHEANGQQPHRAPNGVMKFISRESWILLYDNALSGQSLCTELKRTKDLCECLQVKPKIIIAAQVMTTEAKNKVHDEFGGEFDSAVLSAVYLDDRFRIKSDECRLLKGTDGNALSKVRELCIWFFKEILSRNPEYGPTIELSGGDMSYGYMNTGLTLVTPNCPSNSIPVLWYQDRIDKTYDGPYPRVESRLKQERGFDSHHLEMLRGLMKR
jgi:hypothetical protein